jgi:hypothetical protein
LEKGFKSRGISEIASPNHPAYLIKKGLDIRQLLPYVLSYPVSTAVVGISDVSHLEENVRIASVFKPLGEEKNG